MKQLQNDFTTPEESNRLLELGMPADSANLYHVIPTGYIGFCRDKKFSVIRDEIIKVSCTKYNQAYTEDDIMPCWTAGRLVEIYVIARCLDTSYLPFERGEDMIKYLIRLYEEKAIDLDFSKLEE